MDGNSQYISISLESLAQHLMRPSMRQTQIKRCVLKHVMSNISNATFYLLLQLAILMFLREYKYTITNKHKFHMFYF